MIAIVFFLLMVAITVVIYIKKEKRSYLSGWAFATIVVGWILAGVVVVCFITGYYTSIDAYAKFQVYDKVKTLYTTVIKQTGDAVVKLDNRPGLQIEDIAALVDVGISIENMQHSGITAERIKEARDYMIEIANRKAWYKLAVSRWFVRPFLAKPPDGLLD